MIRRVIQEIKLNLLSPHLFSLYIDWENGIAVRPDIAIIWRGVTPNNSEAWSEDDDNLLRQLYPEHSQIALMQAFPNRAWYRIMDRAKVLKIRRNLPHQGHVRVNVYHRTIRYDDLEAIGKLGQNEEEQEYLHRLANQLAKQTLRGNLSVHWWLPLDSISYAGISNDATSENSEVSLFNLNGFPYEWHHRA